MKKLSVFLTFLLCCILISTAFACVEYTHECLDENNDHKCDVCRAPKTDNCIDENKDHLCDTCKFALTAHVDIDENDVCEFCNKHDRIYLVCCIGGSVFENKE